MKARPILMSAPMVRALLDGRKTQTRRIVKPQPIAVWGQGVTIQDPDHYSAHVRLAEGAGPDPWIRCPYGNAGNVLWVRETWACRLDEDHLSAEQLKGRTPSYWADGPGKCCNTGCAGAAGKKRPSIFMPRWASRLTLRITGVRVERLQEIEEGEAEAEGADSEFGNVGADEKPLHVVGYRNLWERLNGAGSWAANPWVWAITFAVDNRNVDQLLREAA